MIRVALAIPSAFSLLFLLNLLTIRVAFEPFFYSRLQSPYKYGPTFIAANRFTDSVYVFGTTVPFGLVVIAVCIPPAAWIYLTVCAHQRRRLLKLCKEHTRCPVCGYDLRATPGRCPECGSTPARDQVT